MKRAIVMVIGCVLFAGCVVEPDEAESADPQAPAASAQDISDPVAETTLDDDQPPAPVTDAPDPSQSIKPCPSCKGGAE
jgi:PBP1b-binding outer membrane lipoprotein LpoB